ncbi:hypothetical protein RFI_01384 [Reticulomyxa filosa]|uniref:SET domain-containing protein n=2 Tax=Reticulomyxa filosa TaxID=46433 RepID=X6PC86_RETFI|nr:hypothetical protein RFI_01384 [Reticulomyxa filosa]|eukprot:ETO35679.1 hypothetical protein RFI_01384 [Reticulomyxa filosa]
MGIDALKIFFLSVNMILSNRFEKKCEQLLEKKKRGKKKILAYIYSGKSMSKLQQKNTDEEVFQQMCEILREKGNVKGLEFLTLKTFAHDTRGLCSLLSRLPGEEICRIPLEYCLTDYDIDNNTVLKPIWQKHPELAQTPINRFILLFYKEYIKPSKEFYRHWFSLFSKDLSSYSINWSTAELKACGVLCPIQRLTVEVSVWIHKTHQQLKPIVEEFPNIFGEEGVKAFDIDMVRFLCMSCRSRGCRLLIEKSTDKKSDNESKDKDKDKGKENENEKEKENDNEQPIDMSNYHHCFIPIGDFGNHKIGANALKQYQQRFEQRRHVNFSDDNQFANYMSFNKQLMKQKFFEFDKATQHVIIRAQEMIVHGGEVCYEYTAAPNWELLCNFGFALEWNEFDRIIVSCVFDNSNVKRLRKELEILTKMGMSQFLRELDDEHGGKKYSLAVGLTLHDSVPNVLLIANRIKLLSDRQLDSWTQQQIAQMDKIITRKDKINQSKTQAHNDATAKDQSQEEERMNDEMLINQVASSSLSDDNELMKLEELKSIEYIILKNLKQSMIELKSHYQSTKPNIDPRELKHKEVLIVYQSIRRIIFKTIQTLDEKLNDLNIDSGNK